MALRIVSLDHPLKTNRTWKVCESGGRGVLFILAECSNDQAVCADEIVTAQQQGKGPGFVIAWSEATGFFLREAEAGGGKAGQQLHIFSKEDLKGLEDKVCA